MSNKLNLGASQAYFNRLSARVRHVIETRITPFEEMVVPINMLQLMMEDRPTYEFILKNLARLEEDLIVQVLEKAIVNVEAGSYEYNLCRSRLKLRIDCLPYSPTIYRSIGSLTEYDLNSWLILQGTIVRLGQRKTLEKSKVYKCTNCGFTTRLTSTYHNGYCFVPPVKCINETDRPNNNGNAYFKRFYPKGGKRPQSKDSRNSEEDKAVEVNRVPKKGKCGCRNFEPTEEERVFLDYQELKLQEPFRHMISGKMPQSITVLVEGENLIDKFRPGEDVYVSGVLTYRYERLLKDRTVPAEVIFLANNIVGTRRRSFKENHEFSETLSQLSVVMAEHSLYSEEERLDKELKMRQDIIDLFCPSLYDRDLVKLGVLLCLLGGVPHIRHNTRIRGHSHLLLVGQPGTGKSVVLQAATQLVDRAFFVNAIGSTSAGLTVSHSKEKGAWILEPGALVLADQGVCCIDEINLMNKKDHPALLQAMEQQTISSAKAGIIGKLTCRTTVLAACNPVQPGQKYNKFMGMQQNTSLDPALISRFDLILTLLGSDRPEQDLNKADHILQRYILSEGKLFESAEKKKKLTKLKAIFRKASEMEPQISHGQMLQNYFIAIRQEETKTVRALESLCRLAEAHAKLMMRSQTSVFDCVSVIMLMNGAYTADRKKYESHRQQLEGYL